MLRGVASAALLTGALATGAPATAQEPVLIGLVIPGGAEAGGTPAEIRAAADAAIEVANEDGGYRGRPFELRVVNEDGLWGQGLGRVVALAFDQPVIALIGGLDGRSAHLIQQVVIKARIPFLSPWASDPTLSRGMIPWFFQLVPDARQQATAIVAGADHLVLLADTSYDARQFADAVAAAADSTGTTLRRIDAAAPAPATEALHGALSGPGGAGETRVVLATDEADAVRILEWLATLPRCPTVVVPIRLAAATGLRTAARRCHGRVLAPAIFEAGGPAPETEAGDAERDGSGPAARYTREAVDVLVAAIRSAGLDPWRIRDALAEASVDGEAGPVFDEAGRRRGTVRLVELVSLFPPARR